MIRNPNEIQEGAKKIRMLIAGYPGIGKSTLALSAIVHKIAAGEDYRTASGFFKAFRRDFKQATALGMAAPLRAAVARVEQACRNPEPPRDPFEEEQTDGEDDLT